eukprot:gene8611-34050_t
MFASLVANRTCYLEFGNSPCSQVSDKCVDRIGAVSAAYGRAFGVEDWSCELFAEEVVRGGPAFAVSLVISSIEPTLRNVAALGDWQVISPHEAVGVIVAVDNLHSMQDKTYEEATVTGEEEIPEGVVAVLTPDAPALILVTGEEEIPEGVVAVLTPDAPDVLSHVSVRARNMKVLFATCHDPTPLNDLKAMAGKVMHFSTTASGSVTWAEPKESDVAAQKGATESTKMHVPRQSRRALGLSATNTMIAFLLASLSPYPAPRQLTHYLGL